MPLSRKVRLFVGLTEVLQRVGVAPSAESVARRPVAKRLGVKIPKALTGPWPAGVVTTDHEVAGLKVRAYRGAAQGDRPAGVLHVHGGGFVLGGLIGTDHICARMAADSGTTVFALEYGLAPENPFPGPLDECHTVLRWMHEAAAELGIDAAGLVVSGDSAGGNLAAALAIKASYEGPALVGQLLLYPALDHTRSSPSARAYAGPGLSPRDLELCWFHYAGAEPQMDPLLSPLLAADLSGLPPAMVMTVEHDPLRDEGRAYAERLMQAGVDCRAVHYEDYLHGFLSVPRLYDGADPAWAEITGFLRRVSEPAR